MKIYSSFFLTVIFFLSVFPEPSVATDPGKDSPLELKNIMRGELWTGHAPAGVKWAADGRKVFFSWNPENELIASTFYYDLKSEKIKQAENSLQKDVPSSNAVLNESGSAAVFTRDGDLYIHRTKEGKNSLVLDLPERIHSAAFNGKKEFITFIYRDNLYLFDPAKGVMSRLTDFHSGEKPKDEHQGMNEQEEWLYNDQVYLFDVLQEEKEKKELREQRKKTVSAESPKTFYTGNSHISGIEISPDQLYITFRTVERNGKVKIAEMPNYVTETGYTSTEKVRSKVGYPYGNMRMGIYNRSSDSICYVDLGDLPDIHNFPVYDVDQKWEIRDDEIRKVYISEVLWPEEGGFALFSVRSADNKDRWIILLDPETGKTETIDHQHDEAWINGPGIGYTSETGVLGWLPDGKHIYFQSEETGYSHLYTFNIETREKKALTRGSYEVYDLSLSKNGSYFYFGSNEEDPGVRHFYRIPVTGGKAEKLTSMTGRNDVYLSPDEKYMLIRHSFANQPWELYLKKTGNKSPAKRITFSYTDEFQSYEWRVPDFIRFRASDGAEVPARLYAPEDAQKNGAAVIFVHGAGYRQNAHKWWSNYYREYMFHNFLVDKGYTVLDIDYRGSAGYGRDWRTAIYRHMGGKDLSDQVDGAKYLVETLGIDPDRIGIYGGSYGGFITLMAQFTEPGVFKAGAALRPVTDWAHYNHGYTSDILNTPFEDSLAYRRSSPIYFADGLQDHLLICHGVIDDNVHFQDVVRLNQRLIELQKENWELAIYPREKHGFTHWTSWYDEYRRIFRLFEETIGINPQKMGQKEGNL